MCDTNITYSTIVLPVKQILTVPQNCNINVYLLHNLDIKLFAIINWTTRICFCIIQLKIKSFKEIFIICQCGKVAVTVVVLNYLTQCTACLIYLFH